jgi:hypothetical protein
MFLRGGDRRRYTLHTRAGSVSEAPRPLHEARGALAHNKPTTGRRASGRRGSSGASVSVGPCVEQSGHQLQQTEPKGTPLRRMGVQPVVIGGSDSAELDKFQWQRDRALHFRSSASLRQGNFDLRAFSFSNKNNATKRTGGFKRLNSSCCLFVCKGSDSKKGASKEGKAAPRLEGNREGAGGRGA